MFMMWYRSATGRTCLALSEDGVEWKRPELDLEPASNVVLKSNRDAATVVLDHYAGDEKERFKLFEARTKKSPYHIAFGAFVGSFYNLLQSVSQFVGCKHSWA
jgi:hypothetical protein